MHKEKHCAVVIDCWMKKIGEVNFENKPSKFPAFVEEIRKICGTKDFVFGLEDTRVLGVIWLHTLQEGSLKSNM